MRGWVIAILMGLIPSGLYMGARLLLPPIRHVEVVGNSRLSLEEIRGRITPYLRGRNLLTVPAGEIAKVLGNHPLVDGCEVWKRFPDSLLIVIKERPDLRGLETYWIPPEVRSQALTLAGAFQDLTVKGIEYRRGFFTLETAQGTRIHLKATEATQGAMAIRRVLEALGGKVPKEMYFAGPNKVAVNLGGTE